MMQPSTPPRLPHLVAGVDVGDGLLSPQPRPTLTQPPLTRGVASPPTRQVARTLLTGMPTFFPTAARGVGPTVVKDGAECLCLPPTRWQRRGVGKREDVDGDGSGEAMFRMGCTGWG